MLMIRSLLILSCMCVVLCQIQIQSIPLVAFVVVGSSRSFIHSVVYQSIRYNVIDALCPNPRCQAAVFVRVSSSDNTHYKTGFDARGFYVPPNLDHEAYIRKAAESLHDNVKLAIVNIASTEESTQMDNLEISSGNRSLFQLYRRLDARRYSMYFNRFAGYQLAMEFEKSNNCTFDWIVHVRPDMLWGAPLAEISHWNNDRIWVPSHWASDVPDVFAIIPRRWSDMYYSLDDMYGNRAVGCLGGPNFDPRSINSESLTLIGFTDTLRNLAKEEFCLNKFPDPTDQEFDSVANITWNNAGLSEIMLKRKLATYGVSIERNTLGYKTMFSILVREPLSLICFYALSRAMISWAMPYANNTVIMSTGCSFLAEFIRRSQQVSTEVIPDSQCVLLNGNSSRHRNTFGSVSTHDSFKRPTVGITVLNCAITKLLTGFNFLPFRFRPTNDTVGCVTSRDSYFYLSSCKDSTVPVPAKYLITQLFSFLPRTPLPQQIFVYRDEEASVKQCISVVSYAEYNVNSTSSKYHIKMMHCKEPPVSESQLFSIRKINMHSSLFSDSYGAIVWIGHNSTLCLGYNALKGNEVTLRRCHTTDSHTVHDRHCIFRFESTKLEFNE